MVDEGRVIDVTGNRECSRRSNRGLVLGCLFVLALLLTHVALMASERHGEVMGPPPAGIASTIEAAGAMIAKGVPHKDTSAGGRAPALPHSTLGDCPAQQAVLPLLLLLLVLAGLPRLHVAAPRATAPLLGWRARFVLPPPLAPARRRAFLQVFRN